MEAMLARNVTTVIPAQGSVGASGDLAPLAHMVAVMIGEGRATFSGQRMSGGEALAAAGLTPVVLGPKEGIGLINGTQVSTATLFERMPINQLLIDSEYTPHEAVTYNQLNLFENYPDSRGRRDGFSVTSDAFGLKNAATARLAQ